MINIQSNASNPGTSTAPDAPATSLCSAICL